MDRSFRPAVTTLAFLALGAAPLAAQHPNHAQGFRPEHVFAVGDVEHVDLFNGNVTLTIPLGGTYPVGPGLSSGLTLTWTGNVWDWEERFHGASNSSYLQAEPRQRSNAGLGWTVSLGRFLGIAHLGNTSGQPVYESPDQAMHELQPRSLHPGGEDFGSTVRFTQDGTYLRYQEGSRTLEFPDGTTRTFDAADRLVKIADPFGHGVTIDYPKSTRYSGVNDWRLTDTHGRVHRVYFKLAPFYGRVVEEVEVEGFAGAKASYTFSYSNQSVRRPCTVPTSCAGEPCGNTDPVTLPLLTKLTLPDGSAYSMPPGSYELGQAGTCPDDQRMINGQLVRLDLPTGGAFEWDWQIWGFPQGTGTFSPFSKDYGPANPQTKSVGLAERRRITRSNAQLGRWTYTPSLHPTLDFHPEELQVAVEVEPGGDRTRHYFSVWPGKSANEEIPPGGWNRNEYGLPFTRYQTDGSSPARFLSREVFSKSGAKLRSESVRYERSGATQANPRVVSRRTVYHDDGGRRADVDLTSFDGLGHFRTVKTAGNLPGENARTTTTTWNPGKSVSDVPDPSEPWVLGTFTETKVTEGTQTVTREFHFDQATGFLRRTRTRRSAACGGADVIVVRTPHHVSDPHVGFLAREDFYGGDGAGLPCGALGSLDLSGQTVTRQRLHGYTCGVHRASLWLGPGGKEASFLSPDLTIDCKSGLVASSRDTAGLQTTFDYDEQGRLVEEKLPSGEGATTTYQYDRDGTNNLPARVTVRRKSGSTVLTEEQVRFDGFGRVALERREMPDGTNAVRHTLWSSRGWMDQRSEWEADGDRSWTLFRGHDAFGRPGTITLPDGQKITLSYKGKSSRTVTVPVATGVTAAGEPVLTSASTTETYDRFGRLVQVHEPDGTATSYGYDALSNLSRVDQNLGRTPTQTRFFNYDHRGLLRSETHPELGTSVVYSQYDTLGNPGRVRRGGWDLAHAYDEVGRLTEIRERGTSRVWKSWDYATANFQAGRWSNGKLRSASRHNRVIVPGTTSQIEPVVTETYAYDGVGGRISAVTTDVNLATDPRFRTSLSYDALGAVTQRRYPECSDSNPFDEDTFHCFEVSFPRTVSQSFSRGLLAAIPGYASSVTYHPNGTFAQVTHANGVLDLQEKDPDDMARPRRLRTSGASEDLDTGVYAFDGAGNVTKMGSSVYLYDLLSRVRAAEVPLSVDPCTDDRHLQFLTFSSTSTIEACGEIVAGPKVEITSSGDLTLRSGERVVLADGFSVTSGGRFAAAVDPAIEGPDGEAAEATWKGEYDRFGNLTKITTQHPAAAETTRTIGTSSSTNRLTAAAYDGSGNVIGWDGREYRYDPFNMLWQTTANASSGHTFVYGPGDERIWAVDWSAGTASSNWIETWTLRDLDGSPLRQFRSAAGDLSGHWSVHRDYVWRGGSLLAAETPQGRRHFHLDHLGTPRIVTDAAGTTRAHHSYFPFGEEATNPAQDAEALKYTGHERDDLDSGGTTADLDYMHQRYHSPHLGRFLSFDPIGGTELNPQTWNRYSYVLGNPLKYVDPYGLAAIDFCTSADEKVQCEGTIDVVDEDPGDSEEVTFDPLTGVQGLGSLVSGGALHRTLGSNFNNMTRLPISMHGMTFQQGINFAVASGARGDCASDPNCLMIAEAATALENPLLQTIRGAQEFGLAFAFAGPAAGEVGLSLGRTAASQSQAMGRAGVRRLFGKGSGLLNSNRYLRIGFGRSGGNRVFRIGGQWVERTTGRAHFDLWKGGPL